MLEQSPVGSCRRCNSCFCSEILRGRPRALTENPEPPKCRIQQIVNDPLKRSSSSVADVLLRGRPRALTENPEPPKCSIQQIVNDPLKRSSSSVADVLLRGAENGAGVGIKSAAGMPRSQTIRSVAAPHRSDMLISGALAPGGFFHVFLLTENLGSSISRSLSIPQSVSRHPDTTNP
jgi:hypothetical protein